MEKIICSLCSCPDSIVFPEATYHLNLLPPLEIVRCSNCGFIYMNPRPDAEERSMLFSGYVPEWLLPYALATANYAAVTENRMPLFRQRVKYLLSLSEKRRVNDVRLLDIGASSGYMVQAALEAGIEARGVEPGADGIAAARSRGILLEQATAENLPYPDNSFDIVHAHHVFEHVANPLQAALEAFRVLKPGGTLFIEVPNQLSNIRFVRDMLFGRVRQRYRGIRSIHHLSFFSRKSLRFLLRKAGFTDVLIQSKYSVKPKGKFAVFGYMTMLVGFFFCGGELLQAVSKKINNG